MKYLLILTTLFSFNLYSQDCKSVRTITKCDIQKYKLNKQIEELKKAIELQQKDVEKLESELTIRMSQVRIIKQTIVKHIVKKNNVSILYGRGLTSYEVKQVSSNSFKINALQDDLLGLQYSRYLNDSFNVLVQGQTNKTLLLGVGMGF
jgi:tRNA/tmRNA/rRNA uracil-C5-methylase (TrmA/RlmC/RlmD family)